MRLIRHSLVDATKLGQDDKAVVLGIIERGESGPTLATIVRLAAALDIDPGLLISGMRIVGEPS